MWYFELMLRSLASCYLIFKVKIKKDNRVHFMNYALGLGNDAFLRFDHPHLHHQPRVPFHHININSKYTGVKDPHTRIPKFIFDVSCFFTMTDIITIFELQAAPGIIDVLRIASIYVFCLTVCFDAAVLLTNNSMVNFLLEKWFFSLFFACCGSYFGCRIVPGYGTFPGAFIGGSFVGFMDGLWYRFY